MNSEVQNEIRVKACASGFIIVEGPLTYFRASRAAAREARQFPTESPAFFSTPFGKSATRWTPLIVKNAPIT